MGSASSHRVGGPERVRFTVAELLAQNRPSSSAPSAPRVGGAGRTGPASASWPGGSSVRRRLAAAAGTVVMAGTFAAGAAFSASQPTRGGGPFGVETAGAGYPAEATRAPGPRTEPAGPPRRPVGPVVRSVPVRPSVGAPIRRPAGPQARPSVRASVTRELPDTWYVPDEGTVRAPAGSALSSLTPAIGPVHAVSSLLGGPGR